MRRTVSFAFALIVAMLGFAISAQAPQSGVYRIQNVGKSTYVKVTGKYDAQLVTSQNDASYITVGIEKKLSDGTYKVNSLASTYDGGQVEVYDYLTKALTLGEIELRRELSSSSEENVQRAIARMHELVQQYGFMRMMTVDGQADTYHAIAVLPTIPQDVVDVWVAKKNPNGDYVSQITGGNTMWDWCIDIVYRYLDEHSGPGGTNAALASKIRNNLKNIKEGHTYMLTADEDGTFGYIDTEGALTSSINRSWWKLTPKVNTDNVKDGTYRIHNIGKGDYGYVRITGRYHAMPDATEAEASDIRITFDGEANGGQKIVNLGGSYNGADIDVYNYLEKAILIGKMAIYDVLTGGDGVNPASPENIAIAQEYLENEVKKAAFMCIKPVPDKDDAVYAYATFPLIPEVVVTQMYNHHAIAAETQDAAWTFAKQKVLDYLGDNPSTDNTLRAYIIANIDRINPGNTYYLSAHPSDGTFDFAAEGAFDLDDEYFQWGFDVEDVEEDNITSGTYKVRNVQYENFVEVLSKYYAKPDTDEQNATEIHISFNGKLDDGSFKVVNMSAVAKDGSQADILSYVDRAIMLGKVAIADVLNGKSTPENIKRAQDYMEDFVRANAFMRVKPVAGTNYVYAIATIPEIPYDVYHEMFRHGVISEDSKEAAWEYGVNYVLNYLSTHGTNSTLAQLIRNNIGNIRQGHTYYLSEDSDNTFGYVDAQNFSATDKTIQWGFDLEEEDQPLENDFYKIHNVGNDLYVKVEGRYYARPAYSEDEATPIAVSFDGQLDDGSYKVTNLVGDGHDIQQYVQHAIELGTALIHELLDDVSMPENVNRAIEEMTNFVNDNAYMRVKLVPGETDAYYAYVVLPTVPDYIVTEWEKKYPDYNGTMRDWAVEKVKNYLQTHNTDPKLKSMILNNIDKIYEGHTYYLRADQDNTFGIGDFTTGEVDLTDRHYWWGFAEAIKAEPFSGYFRIRNAGEGGKYVNVTGRFAAAPNIDIDAAKTAAGSVIYVGTGETNDTKTLPLDTLRSQGVNVGDYMTFMNDILAVIAETGVEVIQEKLNNPESSLSDYSQYAGLVEPLVMTLLDDIDLNLYVEPTLTSDGKIAYMLEVNIPDLKQYCDLALDALSLMGKTKDQLVNKLKQLEAGATGSMARIYNIAWRTAQYLDDPDEMWAKLKENAKPYVQSYFIDGNGNTGNVGLAPAVGQFILNALNNPEFNYGTTYCLRQDADGTFGYASRERLAEQDLAKWILEPFDEQDPNYDAEAYVPFFMKADISQNDVTTTDDHGTTGNVTEGNTYYYTTGFFDFDAKIESIDAEVFTVASTERVDHPNTGTNTTSPYYGKNFVYYIADLKQVNGEVIPAMTPVIVRSTTPPAQAEENGLNIVLRPVNKPNHPAVETQSEDFAIMKEFIKQLIREKLGLQSAAPAGAPRLIVSQTTSDNLLVGSFLGDDVPSGQENNYLVLTSKTKVKESGNNILNMSGLGMWKNNLSQLEGNKAYLKGLDGETAQADFHFDTTFAEATVGDAPGYIFRFEDGTMTAVNDVTATKTIRSIRYYNVAGIESTTPFDGVNIVVTTFNDGTKSTVKVLK